MADQGKVVITSVVPTAVQTQGIAISGAGTLSATLRPVGVLADSSAAGVVAGPVQIGGTALASCGESITAGELCASDASGQLISLTAGSEHLCFCIALEAGAAADVLISVKII